MIYQNPILPGFHPDPSVCRVGRDFYLVTSTFEYFPGIPVYHSTNLINWQLCGHCLTRQSQLPLQNERSSKGLYAPTIRFHDGVFYMTTTHTGQFGNFIVHAQDPAGPWSEPAPVAVGGIDPSLFWDEDGVCYFCSNADGIVVCPIDPMTGRLLESPRTVCRGTGAKCLEGPHIYKKDGFYMLIVAEGGTEMGHRVSAFRARSIFGPYEACPHNPVLTHMERAQSPFQALGHADLFDDENGQWWAVFLGIRLLPRLKQHLLGRETFLAPVRWQDGWPVIGQGGFILPEMDAPLPDAASVRPVCREVVYDFDRDGLDPRFFFVRNPSLESYRADPAARTLTLRGTQTRLEDVGGAPTMLCLRQEGFDILVQAELDPARTDAARAGLAVFQTAGYHHEIALEKCGAQTQVVLTRHVAGLCDVPACVPVGSDAPVVLWIRADAQCYRFGFVTPGGEEICLGSALCASLGAESVTPRSFTGVLLGMFAWRGDAVFRSFRAVVG